MKVEHIHSSDPSGATYKQFIITATMTVSLDMQDMSVQQEQEYLGRLLKQMGDDMYNHIEDGDVVLAFKLEAADNQETQLIIKGN